MLHGKAVKVDVVCMLARFIYFRSSDYLIQTLLSIYHIGGNIKNITKQQQQQKTHMQL